MPKVTTEQAVRIFDRIESGLDNAALRGMARGMKRVKKLAQDGMPQGSITAVRRGTRTFIVAGDDPNPPPGPLKKRSGKLSRSIGILEPRKDGKRFVSGLTANHPGARVHEGITRSGRRRSPSSSAIIRAKSGGFLKFATRTGFVQVKRVRIRPRPFLFPAIKLGIPLVREAVLDELEALSLREIARA